MRPALPILYFHRVNRVDPPPTAITPENFEALLSFLVNQGYQTLSPSEIKPYLAREFLPRKRPVVITFDDGYADNYFHAYPLLRKHGLNAITFLITRYNSPHPRHPPFRVKPFFLANKEATLDPDHADQFLTWPEIREMERAGTIHCFSHGHSHRQLFRSNRIQGVYRHGQPHWGIYSVPGFQPPSEDFPELARSSLFLGPGFIPDPHHFNELNRLLAHVAFDSQRFMREITLRGDHEMEGRFQTSAEWQELANHEFEVSKNIIEKNLERPCPQFCWPWGQYNRDSWRLGRQMGYEIFHTTHCFVNDRAEAIRSLGRLKVRRFHPWNFGINLSLRSLPRIGYFYGRWRNSPTY